MIELIAAADFEGPAALAALQSLVQFGDVRHGHAADADDDVAGAQAQLAGGCALTHFGDDDTAAGCFLFRNNIGSKIEKIIETRGYPGNLMVKEDLAGVAALIILHVKSLEVKEKYLPFFIDAYNKKNMRRGAVETLVDKIYVQKTNKQVFGTQYGYWNPIEKKREIYPLIEESERNLIIKNLNLK